MQPKKHPDIPIKPITSSMVEGIGHDPFSSTLAVRFRGGKTYHYEGVPTEIANQLTAAESAGQFIARHIRNHYPATLISQ